MISVRPAMEVTLSHGVCAGVHACLTKREALVHTRIGSRLDVLENQELLLAQILVSAHRLAAAASQGAEIDGRPWR